MKFLNYITIISLIAAVYSPWFVIVSVVSIVCSEFHQNYILYKVNTSTESANKVHSELLDLQKSQQSEIDELSSKLKSLLTRQSYGAGK